MLFYYLEQLRGQGYMELNFTYRFQLKPLALMIGLPALIAAIFFVPTSTLQANSLPYSLNSWMGDLSDTLESNTLSDLFLPGTHDSGTSSIPANATGTLAPDLWANKDTQTISLMINDRETASSDTGTNSTITTIYNAIEKTIATDNGGLREAIVDTVGLVASAFSRAQAKSIEWQLNNGIRYLDLRVCDYTGTDVAAGMYLCHGFLGEPLDTVLSDIATFVSQNDKEILVLDFNHTYTGDSLNGSNMTDMSELVSKINDTIGNELIDTSSKNQTLQQIWATGKQIITLFPNDLGSYKNYWNNNNENNSYSNNNTGPVDIWSPWPNASDYTDVINGGITNVSSWENWPSDSKPTFFVLQGQVTPTAETIAVSAACGLLSIYTSLPDAVITLIAGDIATYLGASSPGNITASDCNTSGNSLPSLATVAETANNQVINTLIFGPSWQCEPNIMIVDWYTTDSNEYSTAEYGHYGPQLSARRNSCQ